MYIIQNSKAINECGSSLILQLSLPSSKFQVRRLLDVRLGVRGLYAVNGIFALFLQIKSLEPVQVQNWPAAHLLRTCHTPASH